MAGPDSREKCCQLGQIGSGAKTQFNKKYCSSQIFKLVAKFELPSYASSTNFYCRYYYWIVFTIPNYMKKPYLNARATPERYIGKSTHKLSLKKDTKLLKLRLTVTLMCLQSSCFDLLMAMATEWQPLHVKNA